MSNTDDESVRQIDAFARSALSSKTWCHLLTHDESADERAIFEDLGPVTRRVRGSNMRTWARLFDEFGAAWQFSEYDGSNWGAFFHDSMGDLHMTWPTTVGFVLIVAEPEQVLVDEPAVPSDYTGVDLHDLVAELGDTVEWYAEDEEREPDDPLFRGSLSFDVVLVTDEENHDRVSYLWKQAGAPLAD